MSTNFTNQNFSARPDVLSSFPFSRANELRDNGLLKSEIEGALGPAAKGGSRRNATPVGNAPVQLEAQDQKNKEHADYSIQLPKGHLPQVFSDLSLQINIPDFEGVLAFPLVDITQNKETGTVSLRAAIDTDSTVVVTLNGERSKKHDRFEVHRAGLSILTTTKLARTDFVLASLRAMLSLSEQVYLQIPEIQLDLLLSFEAPLLDTSKMLRRRQIAYRIMVIERATGYEFELPPDISGDEVENIALIYHAIMESSFDWPIDKVTVFLPATEEWLNRMTLVNQLSSFTLGPDPFSKSLFDKQILFGHGTLTVLNKFIEDVEMVQQELARNDGHQVTVVVRSVTGQGRYELSDTPRLPLNAWDSRIQGLINIEDQLDSRLVERYHALAASTLEGLSEQEKTDITTRPDIGEAFLIGDS